MSDRVQKIKEEFEKRIESIDSCPFRNAELGSEKFNEGELYAYKQILAFIDSLPEEPSVKGITWEDVNTLDTLINQVRYEFPNGIGEKSFGLAVLEKFQDYQDVIEEPANEDLEEEINRVDDWYPVELKYIQAIASHFVEWQKQKDEQDFMKKACEYLKREYEDVGIRYIRGVSVDEEIELFKEYMKNKK